MFGVTDNLRAVMLLSTILASAMWASQATAQFYKCVDTSGKVTFSDQGCAANEDAATIRVQPANTIDNSRYQQQRTESGYEAPHATPERPANRNYVTVVGGTSDAERRRDQACKKVSTKHRGAHGLTAAQLAATANLCHGASLPMPEYATDPYAAPTAPPPPAGFASCDAGGCFDVHGLRYSKGAGTTYIPVNGNPACQLLGGQMICP